VLLVFACVACVHVCVHVCLCGGREWKVCVEDVCVFGVSKCVCRHNCECYLYVSCACGRCVRALYCIVERVISVSSWFDLLSVNTFTYTSSTPILIDILFSTLFSFLVFFAPPTTLFSPLILSSLLFSSLLPTILPPLPCLYLLLPSQLPCRAHRGPR
jgi:hypothetical protein